MICQVIINDFEIARRMIYILDEKDFSSQQDIWEDTDELLIRMQELNNDMFRNKLRWCDLDIKHFHVMIVNMLKILSTMSDEIRGDKSTAPVTRLAFFLCGLIFLIQEKTGSRIELLRLNRVSNDDVIYDYSATLDVKIEPTHVPHTGLKVVIDNEEDDV